MENCFRLICLWQTLTILGVVVRLCVGILALVSSNFSLAQPASESFSTRHAKYVRADWSQLPGWGNEAVHEALAAFQVGCLTLGRRDGWAPSCEAAKRETARNSAAARAFFEQNFELLQLRSLNDTDTGVITGYFEPLLRGSKTRSGAYIHPVLAVPDDLLYLDSRELALRDSSQAVLGRVRDRTVALVSASESITAPNPSQGIFLIEIGDLGPDIRDKRIRVRIVKDRIVPYATRQEIERSGLNHARTIAWVDSADALYSMQIQGSGKIQLTDGTVLRLAYAEQNGHPFLPKVSTLRNDGIRTRGLSIGQEKQTQPTTELSPQVQRLIDHFLNQTPREVESTSDAPRRDKQGKPTAAPAGQTHRPQPNDFAAASRPDITVSSANDPSYVFFRQIGDGPEGPIGALGVPLTAGRSVAVDPRTTPLGAPVFVAQVSGEGNSSSLNRLMIAQDTGGAIRGAIRADYFWGFGRQAGNRALQMKDPFKMWLLIPKGLDLMSRQKIRTRSVDGTQGDECLIADPELCME